MSVLDGDPDGARSAPAAASSAIADVLAGAPRPVEVLAVFPAAAYLQHDDGLVAVVAADGVQHPNALVLGHGVAARPLGGLRVGHRGTIGAGAVEVADLRVAVARWFDPTPQLRRTASDLLTSKVDLARAHLLAATGSDGHDLDVHALAVAAALGRGDAAGVVAAAHQLIGAGPGLTPAGDDVLAGLLSATVTLAPAVAPELAPALTATVQAAGVDLVARARSATTAVSAQLLHHAVRGEVAAPAAAVLHALTGRRPLPPALDTLLHVGATSGRDLTVGLLIGAALVVDAASRVTPLDGPLAAPADGPAAAPADVPLAATTIPGAT